MAIRSASECSSWTIGSTMLRSLRKIQSKVIDGELNGEDEHRIVPVPDVKSIEVQPPHHLLDALQRGPGLGRDSEHGRSRTSIASKQVTDWAMA